MALITEVYFLYFHQMNRPPLYLLLLFFLISSFLQAQKMELIADSIAQKMEWYGLKKNSPVLFVHFDKNIYTSREKIWFTAYLLSAAEKDSAHHTLVVNIIRNEDSTVLAHQKFVLVNGLSFGNMTMPDSLLPGNYSFLVHTNLVVNEKPVVSFVQPITVKSDVEPGFTASIKMAEKINPQKDSVKLVFKASSKDIHTLISFADVVYTVGDGKTQLSGKLKTDIYGEVYFTVPLRKASVSNRLHVKAKYKKEVKELQLSLPVYNGTPVVKFFPEGGSLIASNKTVVGWEVKDANGEPLLINGVLYQNDAIVDTIQTNGYGLGRFVFTPKNTNRYYVKLIMIGQDTIQYALPAIVSKGPTVNVTNAVCSDTLVVHIEDREGTSMFGLLHNYTENFMSFPVDMSQTANRSFRIALTDVPRGITALTILDEKGRPVAERLFFAHYDERTELKITSDKPEYETRQKINLSLQIKNQMAYSIKGFVSVACIQDNRIDLRKMTDIESYFYLTNQLESLPFKKDPMGKGADNISYMEDVLLIKGWRKYTWSEMIQTKADDTLQNSKSLFVDGRILRALKPMKKPSSINFFTDHGLETVQTDSSGHFTLTDDQMILAPDKKLVLFVGEKNQSDYDIRINDTYRNLADKLAAKLNYDFFDGGIREKNTETMALKKGEKEMTLAEVVVKSGKQDTNIYGSYGPNQCGDYVCLYNILNCPNHHTGTKPVQGRLYGNGRGGQTLYAGCNETKPENKFMVFLKGIYTAKEFYNTDYTQISSSESMYLSTLYWNHSISLEQGKPADLSFYTSDISGKFRVVVQGITSAGVVHSEYQFTVVRKD